VSTTLGTTTCFGR